MRIVKTCPRYKYPISYKPKFQGWQKDDYEAADVLYIEPMTAKELDETKQQNVFDNPNDYYIEEKFDGTRGVLHFYDHYTRVFSRRVSKKSGWLTENTDSAPHIRDIDCPELAGTVIDGEMFIPNRPFKDVAAIMNCTYDKAIARQEELGWVVFHAFDVLYYKGECVEDKSLKERKKILAEVFAALFKHFDTYDLPVKSVFYYKGSVGLPFTQDMIDICESLKGKSQYEELLRCYSSAGNKKYISLTYKAYYEYIVARGGEGVMVKPIDGKYYHKRGWEYSKIKKFLTRDVIVVGFTAPTREYDGKTPTPEEWNYWEDECGFFYDTSVPEERSFVQKNLHSCIPITRYHYNNWVGNIEYGVVITDDEIAKLPKDKKFDIRDMNISDTPQKVKVVVVGDCAGFDDEMRDYFTNNIDTMIGSVIEIKANEQFKDTGKLRHPRFLRLREDKSALSCTWKDHFG